MQTLLLDYTNIYILYRILFIIKEVSMAKNCIYCKTGLDERSVIDVCQRCGHGVWGEKMFKTIVESMEKSRDSGNLFQGSVGDSTPPRR